MGAKKKIGVSKGNIPWNKGKPWSKRMKKKLSLSKIGKTLGRFRGKDSPHWIGDKVSYHALHAWIRRRWGQPQFCEFCGLTKSSKLNKEGEKRIKDFFNWSMKHGTYSRERSDWFRLCRSCHVKYDKRRNIC